MRGDCSPDIGFALVAALRESVRADAPQLYNLFPFANDQSWLCHNLCGPDWIAVALQRNFSGANVPIVGLAEEPDSSIFRALAHLDNAQTELQRQWTPERFAYLGPYDGRALSWRDIQGCLFDWINSVALPHVMQLVSRLQPQAKRSQSVAPSALPHKDASNEESRYLLKEKIGEGGWAEVFLATDTKLRRPVAVKLFHPGATHISSALDHARTLSRVKHNNIVTIFDIRTLPHPVTNDETNAIIMEVLEGPNLMDILSGPELEPSRARSICTGILAGLNELHKAGIAHTDLHEENVKCDGLGTPKILDILYRGTLANQTKETQDRFFKQDIVNAAKLLADILKHSPLHGVSDFRRQAMGANSVADVERILELTICTSPADSATPEVKDGNPEVSPLRQERGGQHSQGATAPLPDIRVKLTPAVFRKDDRNVHAVRVEVQNHSLRDFFLASVTFQRADNQELLPRRDLLTDQILTQPKILPGDSWGFLIDPVELQAYLAGQEPLAAIVRDKIERQYRSADGELAAALTTALRYAKPW